MANIKYFADRADGTVLEFARVDYRSRKDIRGYDHASGQWVLWFLEPPPSGPDPLASSVVAVRFTLPGNPPQMLDVPDVKAAVHAASAFRRSC